MQPQMMQALMQGLNHASAAPRGSAAALQQQSKAPGGGGGDGDGDGHFYFGRWAWRGGDGMVVSMVKPSDGAQAQAQCGCAAGVSAVMLASWTAGHGFAPREPGDAQEVRTTPAGFEMEGVTACSREQTQLDLGLTDITKFFSYSKLWRMLYFVNDAPFRIRNCGTTTGDWR